MPPQVPQCKQLFSIAEVTEEEDSSQEELLLHRSKPRPGSIHPRDSEHLHHAPLHHSHSPSHHHHFNRDPKPPTKEPSVRQETPQVKSKMQHRVHYADTVDTVNYPEDESANLYENSSGRQVSAHCPPKRTPSIKERALLKGLGDRLRREAMLRSQMAAAAAMDNPDHGPTPPRPYPVSKTVRTLKSPIGRRMEIDVEYGTDNEEPVAYSQGEVVVEQMSSEWWLEGAQGEHKAAHRRELKAESAVNIAAVDVICVVPALRSPCNAVAPNLTAPCSSALKQALGFC